MVPSVLSEGLLDVTWIDANQFENDLLDAMKRNYTRGAENGVNHDEKQSSDRPSESDQMESSTISAAKGVCLLSTVSPIILGEYVESGGFYTDVVEGDNKRIMDHRPREIFLELEKIKRVVRGVESVPSSTLNAAPRRACERKEHVGKNDNIEQQSRKHKIQKNISHDATSDGVGQHAGGDDSKHLFLKKENIRLKEIIKQRDVDLAQARSEIKALAARATEAEHVLQTVHRSKTNAHALDFPFMSGYRKINESHLLGFEWKKICKSSGHNIPIPLRDRLSIPSIQAGPLVQDHIRAFLRLRPMSKLEMSRRSRNCFDIHDDNAKFTVDSLSGENDFCYDQVFGTDVNQTEIYNSICSQVVPDLMSGINCCVMAYGLASSGRTFTITGSLPDYRARFSVGHEGSGMKTQNLSSTAPLVENSDAGITPRLLRDLFNSIRASPSSCEFRVKCSYVAVYLEKVFDLLHSYEEKSINVYEDSRGVQVDGVSEACCFGEGDILGLIQRGRACLSVLSSRMNVEINRSHSILMISVTKIDRAKRLTTTARLHLADLAAFEAPIKAKGQTSRELKITQKCFAALGNVVKGLVEKGGRVPYTDSKLTSILKDALGGNCRTHLIVTASPSSYCIRETLSTILIGQRMRRINTNPRININVDADVYKEWIDALGNKLKGFVFFAQRLIEAVTQSSSNGPCVISAVVWENLAQLLDKEMNFFVDPRTFEEECRGSFAVLELENWWKEWKYLNEDLCHPQTFQEGQLKSHTKNESLLFDIQSEVVVLRRQNDLLVQEKRKKDEDLSKLKKEVKLLSLKIAEFKHNLNLADFKEKQAKLFLRQFRKICWNLQKDFLTERRIEISDITGEEPLFL